MARASSKSSGSTGNRRGKPAPSDTAATPAEITPPQEFDTAGDSVGPVEAGSDDRMTPSQTDTPEAASADDRVLAAEVPEQAPVQEAAVAAPSEPPPPAQPQGGFLPMVLGGLVAAGIGYGAAYMGWLPTRAANEAPNAEMMQAISALQDQIAALPATEPEAMAPVDLSPVLDQIAALSARIDTTNGGIDALAERVGALETRPAPAGDIGPEAAAAGQAQDAALAAERDQAIAEAEAAAATAMAEAEAAAEAARREAEAAIAAAQTEAAGALARAEASAALGLLQAALATGAPFADPLARIAAVTAPPETLTALADTGVPNLETLQRAFPPLARAALPVALQETAGDGLGDRLGAFVMGQIGGRSVAPRDGDDPDAVLSRVEAAVRDGNLTTALGEIAALPEGARAVLAPWVADVEARAAAEAGLAALTEALAAGSN